jgi:hypothetical protein
MAAGHDHTDECTTQTSEGYVCVITGECLEGLLLVSWGFDDTMRTDIAPRYSDVESIADLREIELSSVAHGIIQRAIAGILQCDESIVSQWFTVPQVRPIVCQFGLLSLVMFHLIHRVCVLVGARHWYFRCAIGNNPACYCITWRHCNQVSGCASPPCVGERYCTTVV